MDERDALEPIETASRDEIGALQLSRMRASLIRAYDHVAHHRAAFDAAGVHPSDLRDLTDLARFPFTTKEDLRRGYPFGMFAVPRGEVSRIHASSGTTGRPTVVGYTATDVSTWADLMARSLRAAGVRAGDRVHVAYGYGLFTGGLGAHYGAERSGLHGDPDVGRDDRAPGAADHRLLTGRDHGHPLVHADDHRRDGAGGCDPSSTSLRVGVFGAEPWTERMRTELEQTTGMDAVDIYGLSEVMGPGVAQECVETKDGLHVWEDHFYPEVVDPVTGEVLDDGEVGELVFTSLTKEAMPVVRYRTRDLTRLLPGTARTDAADGEGHRTHRRHDHPARRQPVPHPDRGADSRYRRALAAVPVRVEPLGALGRADGAGGGAPGRGCARAGRGGGAAA